jgi:hypothetical protein
MSTISFTSFLVTKSKPEDGTELVDVPCFYKLPPSGLTMLYGSEDIRGEMAGHIIEAMKTGKVFSEITVRIDLPGDRFPIERVSLDLLPEITVLNLRRIKSDVVELCAGIWDKYVEERRISKKYAENPFQDTNVVIPEPEFIDYLHKNKAFKHLEVIIYRIKEPKREARFLATMFSDQSVSKIVARNRQHGEFKMVMPARIRTGRRKKAATG